MLLLFILACIGLTHILVDSRLFEPVRNWIIEKKFEFLANILSCYQCCGVYSGFFLALICDPLGGYAEWGWFGYFTQAFLWGFASSYLSMLAAALMNYLDRPWTQQ